MFCVELEKEEEKEEEEKEEEDEEEEEEEDISFLLVVLKNYKSLYHCSTNVCM